MKAIHRVQKTSVDAACSALEQLVLVRILPDLTASTTAEDPLKDWLEKACVTYTLFATSNPTPVPQSVVERLENMCSAIVHRTGKGLSPRATHAMQTLIWKTTTSNGDVGEAWCTLLQHTIFDSAGHTSKAKIGR
jgi:hypothetical protein